MRFYHIKDCSAATIEYRALLNLRFGYRCLGVAYKDSWIKYNNFWTNLVPKLSLMFFAKTDCGGEVWLFHFKYNKRVFSLVRKNRKFKLVFK